MSKRLLIAALPGLLCVGCAEDVFTSFTTTTEEFVQNTAAAIDVLWVVDNSESMAEEQAGIGSEFEAFIGNLIESEVDYNIGVVSTDIKEEGRLNYNSEGEDVAVIKRDTPRASAAFLENVRVGTQGSRIERSFETAALALGKGVGWEPGDPVVLPNTGFPRLDASLFVIMVSDEDDKSFGPVTYYRRLFEGYKGPGNESRISVSAIAGPFSTSAPEGCTSDRGQAQPGDRYIDLAGQTGGVWANICDPFAETLRELSVTAAGLKSIFELTGQPSLDFSVTGCDEISTIEGFCVRVDGVAVDPKDGQGWVYDPDLNAIIFGASDIPPPQAIITVEYLEL